MITWEKNRTSIFKILLSRKCKLYKQKSKNALYITKSGFYICKNWADTMCKFFCKSAIFWHRYTSIKRIKLLLYTSLERKHLKRNLTLNNNLLDKFKYSMWWTATFITSILLALKFRFLPLALKIYIYLYIWVPVNVK